MVDQQDAASVASGALDAGALGKLKWRCRRGLLENDLLIERFLDRHGERLTVRQGQALARMMDLSDNDLLDLLLRRAEPSGALATADIAQLLDLMRPPQ